MGTHVTTKLWLGQALLLTTMLLSIQQVSAAESILVLRSDGASFEDVLRGMVEDLEEDMVFHDQIIDNNTTVADISHYVATKSPKIIVLMGNRAIIAYYKFQKNVPFTRFPPSIALAALYIDKLLARLTNATGIRYEIPAVTSMVNLRSLVKTPIRRVGVVYRQWLHSFVQANQMYCQQEGIKLIGISIGNRERDFTVSVKRALNQLIDRRIDAFWILNDNVMLGKNVIINAWLPILRRAKKPVVVGAKSLISTQLDFGTFGIFPDHYALGVQGANAITEIMEDNWHIGNRKIEQPISIKKLLNITLTNKRGILVNNDKLKEVDELVK